MTRPHLAPAALVALAAALAACADTPFGEEGSDEGVVESRPVEPGDDVALKAGAVDCAARTDTGYEAGRAFRITVVHVDGKPVEVQTANAFARLRDAAAADGVNIRVVSGFRTHAEQSYLYYDCYLDCRCNHCNLAAAPGYSNHQSGYALDLNTEDAAVLRWLNRNAARHGFVRTVPSEDWHWEYSGGEVKDGICAPGGGPGASAVLRFANVHPGGRVGNGFWLKVEADPAVHHVRYFAGTWPVGASEDRTQGFPARISLNTLGNRSIVARGYNANDRPLGEATVQVTVTEGEAYRPPLAFVSPAEAGWYRNGVWLKVDAPAGTARVIFSAGRFVLGEGAPADGFALRTVFQALGHRTVNAVAQDARGRELARGAVTFRVTPGDDAAAPPGVHWISPAAGGTYGASMTLRAVASDSVKVVRFAADGWALGEVAPDEGVATLTYTFQQGGPRRLEVEAVDAAGATVARDAIQVTIGR